MQPFRVVELEVLLEPFRGFLNRRVIVQENLLVLDASPEPFHKHVVERPFSAIHTDLRTNFLQQIRERYTRKLRPLVRIKNILAPHAKIRSQIVPPLSPFPAPTAAGADHPPKAVPERPARAQRWAELLACVFGLDMEKCVDCGGPLKIVSAILDPHAITAILTYLKLPDKPPELASARIPEQNQFT
jgi:hypothetical protein